MPNFEQNTVSVIFVGKVNYLDDRGAASLPFPLCTYPTSLVRNLARNLVSQSHQQLTTPTALFDGIYTQKNNLVLVAWAVASIQSLRHKLNKWIKHAYPEVTCSCSTSSMTVKNFKATDYSFQFTDILECHCRLFPIYCHKQQYYKAQPHKAVRKGEKAPSLILLKMELELRTQLKSTVVLLLQFLWNTK